MAMKKHGLFKKILSSFLSASCALSMAAVGTTLASTTANAAIAPTSGDPSTFSWDNATVYFLLIDRFKNGDTSNDGAYGRVKTVAGDNRATFHGGDFAGITEKINDGYFTDLGVNAIWMTAPYEQLHGYILGENFAHYSYHGYYVTDYTETDAAYGTKQEFQTLVDAAHSKGIRIIMDIVMNHAGYNNMIDMNEYNYGTLLDGWKQVYDAGDLANYHKKIDYESDAAAWGRWWGPDWVRSGLPGYNTSGEGPSEQIESLTGLPDFRTESSKQVGIPQFLVTKWTKEGTLSEKQSKYGTSNTVTGFISDWLSDWVRTYGIDGFRCDTAKHVGVDAWKQLKDKCVAALKEWKQANPTKKLDDLDFWMTGEHWDWKVNGGRRDYFTSGAFDSMINFETQGGGLLTPERVASTYQDYADKINSDPNFNALSYISSHDSTLARAGNPDYYMGSAFLLTPGAVQIYYGDESARDFVPGVPKKDDGHAYRSDMNWGENTELVKHWGIVGRFRNSHIAVGAGANVALTASSGIAFARTYDKGINDKIAAVINASGSVEIDVSAIWGNGTTLENFYDGTTAVVTGGKVTFSAGAHGTILIQEPDGERGVVTVQHINQDTGAVIKTDMVSGLVGESYSVSADAELTKTYDLVKTEGKTSGKFSADGATVKFYYHLDPTKFGTITITHIDAATGESIAPSETITGKVGASYSAEPAEVKNYEVDLAASTNTSGTFKSGTDIKVVFKYNYVEPTGLVIHYYNSSWSTVNMYTYDERSGTAKEFSGKWPGTAMKSEGNGWFVGEADTEWALVIFNNGAGTQEPSGGTAAKGYEATGEVWIKDGKPQSAGKVKVIYKGSDGTSLGSETLTGLTGETYTTTAKTFSGYTLSSPPSNATGTFAATTITVTYVYDSDVPPPDPLTNKSKLSATSIDLGESITATAAASGGTTPYKYAFFYKLKSQSTWTKVKDYSTTKTAAFTPSKEGKYEACIKVKDANNTEAKKYIDFEVKNSPLTNNSTVSATKIALGSTITAKGAATGGTTPYKFAYYYKQKSQSSWTTAKDFSTTTSVSIKPAKAVAYQICIKVKDNTGTIVKKYFDITVVQPVTNISKLSATSIAEGKSVTVTCSATGGTGYYNYAVFYKKDSQSKWTMAQDYSSNDTVTIKPASTGTYNVCIKVKDTNGTEAKQYIDFKVTAQTALANTSTVSSTSIVKGKSVTVTCSATGGAGSNKYAVYYKKSTASSWTEQQSFGTNTKVTLTLSSAAVYDICTKVKDSKGTISKKYLSVAVNTATATLKNTSTVSATSVSKGTKVTIKGAASGVTDEVTYQYAYKIEGDSNYTIIKNYTSSTSATFTPSTAGNYTVRVIAQDMKPSYAVKTLYVTVK